MRIELPDQIAESMSQMNNIVEQFRNMLETSVSLEDFDSRVQKILHMSHQYVYQRLNPINFEETDLPKNDKSAKLAELSRLVRSDLTLMPTMSELRKFLMSTGGGIVPTARELKRATEELGIDVEGKGKRAYVNAIIEWINEA